MDANGDVDVWERLWPLTDRFEAFCLDQNIPVPSYTRVPKRILLDQFNAINPATLSAELARTYQLFQSLDQDEFDLMFSELYNPFRLSTRKLH